ncbi:MAG: DUF3050 domain-containing protein [Alphaproteobacteria bacterium]
MEPERIDDLKHRLLSHPLYRNVTDERSLRVFMRSHVFAVWDFQSLLAALRSRLTCPQVPWRPTADREARRLVNEIALDEESGEHPDGGFASHFELYVDAMRRAGADVAPISAFVAGLDAGGPIADHLGSDLPPGVASFVGRTFATIESGRLHEIVAAFSTGREDVIPDMFRRLVDRLADDSPGRWGLFRHYLEIHIRHDESRHGPMARALLERACAGDPALESQARTTAVRSLEARIEFWDAILDAIRIEAAVAA